MSTTSASKSTFDTLPAELHNLIWSYCLPGPRILTLSLDYRNKPHFCTRDPQPVLLSTCQSSRSYLLSPSQGGYILIRTSRRDASQASRQDISGLHAHLAFHPQRDSVRFRENGMLRQKELGLTSREGKIVRIERLVLKERMLRYLSESSDEGKRWREWLLLEGGVQELTVLRELEWNVPVLEGAHWGTESHIVADFMEMLLTERGQLRKLRMPELRYEEEEVLDERDAFCGDHITGSRGLSLFTSSGFRRKWKIRHVFFLDPECGRKNLRTQRRRRSFVPNTAGPRLIEEEYLLCSKPRFDEGRHKEQSNPIVHTEPNWEPRSSLVV
ncbi:hypothetical protein DL95DRAFT_418720 [Leptodontidium sp. 2 PMI_412]|nr:hypothetical protein DL95DRAFT_418720 [Leptodontidium sp. 2 PMI_412]